VDLNSQDFLDQFPEFDNKNVRSELIESFLSAATKRCPVSVWGDPAENPDSFRNEAILYLAAHRYLARLEVMARLAAIASGSDGGNLPQSQMIESDLKTTIYGAYYSDLADRVGYITGFPL